MKTILTIACLLGSLSFSFAQVTSEGLGDAAEKFIEKSKKESAGKFIVFDHVTETQYDMKLISIHDSKVHKIDADKYFVCVDVMDEKGVKYDVDIFIQGSTNDKLTVYEMKIHKANGKVRYSWVTNDSGYESIEVNEAEMQKLQNRRSE
jgi:hypothetical protein